MSWEGWFEFLCTNGHFFVPVNDDEETPVCPFCKAQAAYVHMVDVTNGECQDVECFSCRSARELLELEKAVTISRCPTCLHVKVEEEETFKLPPPKPWKKTVFDVN